MPKQVKSSAFRTRDEEFMRLALRLARRGLETVSPNPMVGAVVVRGGRIVGQGYHRRFGGDHAEVEALRDAGDARHSDVYITLEPCAHHGKTPPCADALVAAGVRRVIYAAPDPFSRARGRGPRLLRRHGIEVVAGVCRDDALALNRPFFHWVETGTPWVILKWAMTLDGKIATAAGESRWITGDKARRHAHGLRRRVDAVLVGTQTALLDDPRLDPRPARGRTPARFVLDRRGRLPWKSRFLQAESDVSGYGARWYVTTRAVAARRRQRLSAQGVEVLVAPVRRGKFELTELFSRIGALGISQVLVEGGASLLGECLAAGAAHEAAVYLAPRIAGGTSAPSAVGGPGVSRLEETPWLEQPQVKRLGRDLLVQGNLV